MNYNEQPVADVRSDPTSKRNRYDWTRSETVSSAILGAVAEFKGVDPLQLDVLYDVVDPDALDALFSGPRRPSTQSAEKVTFRFSGTEVTVRDTGSLVVRPADEATDQ